MVKLSGEVVPSTPEDEDVEEVAKKTSKFNGNKDTTKSVSDDESAGEGDEEDEEEYEIAAILDAKKGIFGDKSAFGYLVAWKGYSAEHNSWVNEDDAANAEELIREYWSKRRQEERKKPGRKPEPASSARARKSMDEESSPKAESAGSKRGRGRSSKAQSEEPGSADEEEKLIRPKKRKAAGEGAASKAGRRSLTSLARDTDQDGDISMLEGLATQNLILEAKNVKELQNVKCWEDKIDKVTTVERVGKELMVYFLTRKGEYVQEISTICAEKCPLKLIKFYESHIQWRMATSED